MSGPLPLALIYDPKHASRALQADAVASLARSIERLGLRTPITVRPTSRIRDGQPADVWEVVTGRHRVEAARKLGWTEIDAVVRECDEDDARLWEIAENLHRAELTPDERDAHIREWRDLVGAKVRAGTHLPGGEQPNDLGNRKVSRELGVSEKTVREAVQLGNLTDHARDVAADAELTRKEKLEVAKAAPEVQVAKVREIAERKVIIAPEPLDGPEAIEAQVKRLMSAWNAAGPEAREEFQRRTEATVFDRTRAGEAA